MKLLIFKTDIKTLSKLQIVKDLFNKDIGVLQWNIDMEDVDNVLRIEANKNLKTSEVIHLINKQGFFCEELLD